MEDGSNKSEVTTSKTGTKTAGGVWHDGDGNAFQPAHYLPYCKGE